MEDWAREQGFLLRRDDYGNIVVGVSASPGYERAPVVVLQGHLDMVCEQSPGIDFDFLNDAIQIHIDRDWLSAVGTTLGADNGIGVAAALAVADDKTVLHGPLEILLTVEEELGLKGAQQLNGSLVQGRILINLDSEDTAFYIGCAGASDTLGVFRVQFTQDLPPGQAMTITISGLHGGHSGLAVLGNPNNAIKILASILGEIRSRSLEFGIVAIQGGNNRNAIPREAVATLWVAETSRLSVEGVIGRTTVLLREELADCEENLRVDWVESDAVPAQGVWKTADADRILQTLLACPHGVQSMSRTIANLVETSNNLAMVKTANEEVTICTLARSSSSLGLKAVSEQVAALFLLAGAAVEVHNGYPGWQPDLNSPLLLKARGVYQRIFGRWPEVKAIHAGLECGVIGTRISGVDAISFGPTIEGAHTPAERVHIGSVAAFYQLLTTLLGEFARSGTSAS